MSANGLKTKSYSRGRLRWIPSDESRRGDRGGVADGKRTGPVHTQNFNSTCGCEWWRSGSDLWQLIKHEAPRVCACARTFTQFELINYHPYSCLCFAASRKALPVSVWPPRGRLFTSLGNVPRPGASSKALLKSSDRLGRFRHDGDDSRSAFWY